ncbi:hypothetical protein CTKA_01535 [Chthonomonas calidirosea]|uniref:hypothetical protein n=1 Tax=Chthonomonas calidirosea TaxID=454171 RepID=UPI0006ECB215|nr:hypothetical protein [Chthonomonas calidirosea]CEK17593.1 hypothetical protein CTKA_01535 [Chthonomonas calidirosea]
MLQLLQALLPGAVMTQVVHRKVVGVAVGARTDGGQLFRRSFEQVLYELLAAIFYVLCRGLETAGLHPGKLGKLLKLFITERFHGETRFLRKAKRTASRSEAMRVKRHQL